MKKWTNPQLKDLSVSCTKQTGCSNYVPTNVTLGLFDDLWDKIKDHVFDEMCKTCAKLDKKGWQLWVDTKNDLIKPFCAEHNPNYTPSC